MSADGIGSSTKYNSEWKIINDHHLEREWTFPNFKTALEFVNAVGVIAEAENHHPDIYLAWGKVKLQLWTHTVNGLTEKDKILASKFDTIIKQGGNK
jgi:4a-hydroxytetrahydrobiopterin dehydratase